ncbi:MAG: hypothetical protein ACO1SX_06395 [Actinomycetota bacterium]
MSQTQNPSTLDLLLDPVSRCLTPDAARRLVDLRADPELQERMELWAEKSTEGQLTPEEREEYDTYVRTIHVIGILQAKARRLLASQSSG